MAFSNICFLPQYMLPFLSFAFCICKMPSSFSYVFMFITPQEFMMSQYSTNEIHGGSAAKRAFPRKQLCICSCCQDKVSSHIIEEQKWCHWQSIPSSSHCSCTDPAIKRPRNVDNYCNIAYVSFERATGNDDSIPNPSPLNITHIIIPGRKVREKFKKQHTSEFSHFLEKNKNN